MTGHIIVLRRLEGRHRFVSEFDFREKGAMVLDLTAAQEENLRRFFQDNDIKTHGNRFVVALAGRHLRNQLEFLASIPDLIVIDEDACRNFLGLRRRYQWERAFHKLSHAKFVLSGFSTAWKFVKQGLDAVAVPKSFDSSAVANQMNLSDRPIEFGFLGNLTVRGYGRRQRALADFASRLSLQRFSRLPQSEYYKKLGEIRFFINSDEGFDEYMIKNFEALASGCILVTNRMRDAVSLGFRDMSNCILYDSVEEAVEKIHILQKDSDLMCAIATAGMNLALSNFSVEQRNSSVWRIVQEHKVGFHYTDKRNIVRAFWPELVAITNGTIKNKIRSRIEILKK